MPRFLLPLLILAIGWSTAYTRPRLARALACVSASTLLVMVGFLAVTGCLRFSDATWSEFHRGTGHTLVIATWLAVPFTLGIAICNTPRHRWLLVMGKALVVTAALGLIVVSSISGYLLKDDENAAFNDNYQRFIVLHAMALPGATVLLLFAWCWFFWPTNDASLTQ